jgi:hypothetical protein
VNWVPWFQKHLKSSLPVCIGLATSDVGSRIGTDFIYVDRGYWDRSERFRIVRGGIHLTTLLDRPGDRLTYSEMRPWRSRGCFVVVIPPSPWQCRQIPGASEWLANLKLETDREVRVKHDKQLPFAEYLLGAHCVVSYGSVAAVKAAMWGYPVLSGPHCPATPICCEDLEHPVLKDREPWLRSLSYAQWTQEELKTLDMENYEYSRRNDVQ